MVTWSPQARADLKAIHDYIARDSASTAKKIVNQIYDKTNVLSHHPYLGKIIPEYRRHDLRELHSHSWRVFYRVQQQVHVLAVVHQRRHHITAILKP